MQQSDAPQRQGWMDRARAVAVGMVLLCHAMEFACVFRNEPYWDPRPLSEWAVKLTLLTLGRLGVPVFLMLTGALILGKDFSTDDKIVRFYRTHLLRLAVCIGCWVVLYTFFLGWINQTGFEWRRLVTALFTTSQVQLGHMWYAPMILGMYLFLPFVARAVQNASLKSLWLPMTVTFVMTLGLVSVHFVQRALGMATRDSLLDLSFSGGCYGLYIVTGYLLVEKQCLRRLPGWAVGLGCLALFVLTVLFQVWIYSRGGSDRVWYDFAGVFLCSVLMLEGFRRGPQRRWGQPVWEWISRRSFAIYFLHFPVMRVMYEFGWHRLASSAWWAQAGFLWAVSLAVSALAIVPLQKIPWARRFLLYIS